MKKLILISCLVTIMLSTACDSISNAWEHISGVQNNAGTKIHMKQSKIIAEKFPYPTIGLTGFNEVSYKGFSFEKFDEYVYGKAIRTEGYSTIEIAVQHERKDEYGYSYLDKPITIGQVDVNESKKYADFTAWRKKYSTKTMWDRTREPRRGSNTQW